ncbi:division/cell wall cluster transcriptional repressor MraZ [Acetobacter oeni]|uniref:Transcriptional regulator MraZ n=1 Tax=Acetobacter oeni TaxID=304077 RepID=A0A511XHZ2_9PROT|nr:division/cell wall cluster transcriptional repressor MraZ [Acetobacter oeni]MBB3882508.1 MraZ protein [Acetobacter oeni]NHO18680.1 division/cell wall cluster transcriptional repressor MraZ [Acetobacter oeni]GBR11802.1 cell division protein MraZ [Acetobacter oeni LMG 21952]GEN62555.1 transcriptional regulator MraZ [Acetobacter oeni]
MSVFLGTHQNRIDAKGRVSIPAGFRTVLRAKAVEGESLMVLRPSHTQACIEAWPSAVFSALGQPLDRLDMFSDDHDDLAAALYADAYPIDSDREGRIIIPEFLREHAGIGDEVAFMGLGRIFQIWEPGAAAERRAEARLRSRRVTLPGNRPGADAGDRSGGDA